MIVNGALTNHFSSIKSECSDQLRLDFLLRFCCSVNLAGRRAPKIFGNGFFTSILLRVNYCMTIVWVLAALGCNLMEKKLNCQFVG